MLTDSNVQMSTYFAIICSIASTTQEFVHYIRALRDKLPRYGRAINNSFLSTVNATGVCKNFLFKKDIMQLSTSLIENTFSLKMSFK